MASPDMPPMEPVTGSTNVAARSYDPVMKRVFVRFKDGSLYQKDGVTPHTWEHFRKAPSAGKFVHAHLNPMQRVK